MQGQFELEIGFLVLWLFDVIWMIGTKLVHYCEGAVGTLLDGSKIVRLLCVIAHRNNMQCEYDTLMYDV